MSKRIESGIFSRLRDLLDKSGKAVPQPMEMVQRPLVNYDPDTISKPEQIEGWASVIFCYEMSSKKDPQARAQIRETLLGLARRILQDATSVSCTARASLWIDDGAGVACIASDNLNVTYKDGSTGALHFNAGQIIDELPDVASVQASGRIRTIIDTHFPNLNPDGQVLERGELFSTPSIYQ